MFYTTFLSANQTYIIWLRAKIESSVGIFGYVTKAKTIGSVYQLRYAKKDSKKLLSGLYSKKDAICLTRKKEKVVKALPTENLKMRGW